MPSLGELFVFCGLVVPGVVFLWAFVAWAVVGMWREITRW